MRVLVFSVVLLAALVRAAGADYSTGFAAYIRGDYAAALAEWLPLANAGNASAQRNVGEIYSAGLGVEQDLAAAARWYEKAAVQGHVTAQYNLGVMYADGRGVPNDPESAAYWLRRAADQGHPVAGSRLQGLLASPVVESAAAVAGLPRPKPAPPPRPGAAAAAEVPPKPDGLPAPTALASVGPPTPQLSTAWQAYATGDTARALRLWQEAAGAGSDLARHNVAALYARGDGVPQDFAAATEWLLPLAGRGDADAQFKLAVVAQLAGRHNDALAWVRRAADLGYPWAQASVGVQHYEGRGVDRDLSLALQWYRRAAAGHGLADQPYILELIEDTLPRRPTKRLSAAPRWLSRWLDADAGALADALAAYAAADYDTALTKLGPLADQDMPEAVTTLAIMLDRGLGLPADPDGAVALLSHAAELGDTEAQYRLGVKYAQTGTPSDAVAAAELFAAAAARDHPQAAYNLAVLWLSGAVATGGPADAAALLRLSAEAGVPVAQYDLALMYASGEGVSPDPRQAREWLTAAASQGLPEAQFAVGLSFVGARADYAVAHRWLAQATANAAVALRVRRPFPAR